MESRFRPVIIITTGRSGSTLLQRYLNASPELVVWGEHGGFISGLSNTYNNFMNAPHLQKMLSLGRKHSSSLLDSEASVNVDIEWTNNFTSEDLRNAFRDLIVNVFTIGLPSEKRWGFKEIRYKRKEVRFLKELFPEAQFIFLLRNPIDTLASMVAAWEKGSDIWENKLWKRDKSVLRELQDIISKHVTRVMPIIESIQTLHHNNVGFLVRYEVLKQDPASVLRQLFSFLNIEMISNKKIQSIAGDVRQATKKNRIKEALCDDFADNEDIVKLLKAYEAFDFNRL